MPAKKNLKAELFHCFISNDTIRNFASADKYALMPCFIKPIAEMLKNEHYKRKEMPFKNEVGIYLDGVEIEQAKRNKVNRKRTVDFLFGVGNNWILFTEAKFDVSNPREMKVSELKEKIVHSKELVSKRVDNLYLQRYYCRFDFLSSNSLHFAFASYVFNI